MSNEIYISQTWFSIHKSPVEGGPFALNIQYHPEDNGDFLLPEEVSELIEWLKENFDV